MGPMKSQEAIKVGGGGRRVRKTFEDATLLVLEVKERGGIQVLGKVNRWILP